MHPLAPPGGALVTASYRDARRVRACGYRLVQTSVGAPKWLGPLPQLDAAKPWGLLSPELDPADFDRRYIARLAKHWNRIERDLDRLLAEHGRIALACWEADPANCHRSLLADFIEHRTGINVPELQPSITGLSQRAQLRLEGS